jgi:hypothetical protein
MPYSHSPVFIVGAGRSGTTLLRSLLSAHSRLAVTPETHYMKWAERSGGFEMAPTDFAPLWEEYMTTWRFEALGVEPQRCREIAAELGGTTCRNAFLAMLVAYGEEVGKARVGEKSPSHVRYLARLFEWYPEARVLVMLRDPRAVLASRLRSPWVTRDITPPSVRHGLAVQSRLHAVASDVAGWAGVYRDHVPPWLADPRVRVVAYEALVADPEAEVRAVCEHLGEPFEPAMLERRSSGTVPMPAAEVPDAQLADYQREHHAQTLRPISADSLEKWKRELSTAEVAIVEGVCEELMVQWGYTPTLSAPARAAGRALSMAVLAARRVERAARARAGTLKGRMQGKMS